MKIQFCTLLFIVTTICSFSQDKEGMEHNAESRTKCAAIYLNTSTGINNNTGILGLNIEASVSKNVSIDGGAGISSWGNKLSVGGKYFLDPCHIGWAFGGGLTYNTGKTNFETNEETIYKIVEKVYVNEQPMLNAYFAAFKYWELGKGYNHIYMELGYSVAFNNNQLEQVGGDAMSNAGINAAKFGSPGGFIIATGITFGIK